ncbi:hypothetical protein BCR34DRAFT_597586 [Clohesyomyces aquaticus]|uniref:FAD-binding PCMH-type domain-containing protein n=1 Tax=Clohesyomyces aquaticus TaxID=1231657 RepID=A0A1Y2A246_9PLEO|nr:hypothetical protein BCR34DRAFT_597586 [Clohesyomyces aquaticus]
MATLDSLKHALRQKAEGVASFQKNPLSDAQYSAAFGLLVEDTGWDTYHDFIIPQLSESLGPLFSSRGSISVLEIGPGPKSVLEYLPNGTRRKIRRYTALEPNDLFASALESRLCPNSEMGLPFPCVEVPPHINRRPFSAGEENGAGGAGCSPSDPHEKYDVILFCHSMYGMKPKRRFIEQALEMLTERPNDGIVVVFHRDGTLYLEGLVCHRTATFPTGVVSVANDDDILDSFASFIVGYVMQNGDVGKAVRSEWRKVCRSMGRIEETHSHQLSFSSPNIMAAFTKHATSLPELIELLPLARADYTVKNREAVLQRPASVVRPTNIGQVQDCIRWALNHGASLAVVGGGHSGHCLWTNVVSVDMGAFDEVHILKARETGTSSDSDSNHLVVIGAGCKSGHIVSKTMEAGLTIPLGARPSVGAGLWLQGGIGHLSRVHGLACDSIVGAVMVSADSAHVIYIGQVPSQYQPTGAVRPENENDILWAIRGAGTNFGIVVSVTFKAHAARTYFVENRIIPLRNNLEAQHELRHFDTKIAKNLRRKCAADAYLYWNAGKMHLGITMLESSAATLDFTVPKPSTESIDWGTGTHVRTVDAIGLFETEMYVSWMHGGHAGGKTSSFKRCVFLKDIGGDIIFEQLMAAIVKRPTSLCYLHLLHGGGAIMDTATDATAFGCRDWDFACVVTGVWPRDQDGTESARSTVQWVYDVVRALLPLSTGVYAADLGPDPRDKALAAQAFGLNRSRLARLKQELDPRNVLAYACPLLLPKTREGPKLVVLVTGKSCAGKDYCAGIWVSKLNQHNPKIIARSVSISDATKQEYAHATGANLSRLLNDRVYKEQHRPALTKFFLEQVQQRPRLPEEHFLNLLHDAADIDVLLITGMRDEAPVATFSHLVPHCKLIEVHVRVSQKLRHARRGGHSSSGEGGEQDKDTDAELMVLNHCPSLIFINNMSGHAAPEIFAGQHLFPFLHEDLQRLADMVRLVPGFPHPNVEFRHVLGISQKRGGLALCTSLLQTHFTGDWAKVAAIACCETGGLIFASVLSSQVNVPLALIREAGKLPPPTLSVVKPSSYISSMAPSSSSVKRIQMERDVVGKGDSVVVVDDVLSTGETLCAVLMLLGEAGVRAENVRVVVVAEFPFHRGRALLRDRGFGMVDVRSLLVFGGA